MTKAPYRKSLTTQRAPRPFGASDPHDADFSVAVLMTFYIIIRSDKILQHFIPVAFALKFSSFIIGSGISAKRC